MIQLQFSRQGDLISSAIAWFDHGTFSHVDAVLPDGTLLGSRSDHKGGKPSGVQIRPTDYADFVQKVIFSIPASRKQETLFYNFLTSQIGKPYDREAIFGFVTGRYWRDPDSWICSELIAAALESAGVFQQPLWLGVSKIAPVSLALVVSAIPGVTHKGN